MIVFTYDKSIFSAESDEWGGIVDSIKQVVDKSSSKVKSKIDSFQKSLSESVIEIRKTQSEMQQSLIDIFKLQKKVNENIAIGNQAQ